MIFSYNTTFSDGYDLASEVICFLCHYIGHNLDDLACQNRKGELLTVRFACYRHALRYIEKEYLLLYKTVSIEECSPADASIDFETQTEIEDYTKVDTIIHQMRLTVTDAETLNYYAERTTPRTATSRDLHRKRHGGHRAGDDHQHDHQAFEGSGGAAGGA